MVFNIIFYILIFVIGTLFGSFATLAIYRLPQKKDIIKERSFCPNCNHKLGFLDLIPIFSYIFLGGKCRYCKEKIRSRYLIVELLLGILAVALFTILRISPLEITVAKFMNFLSFMIYATVIIIVAGIDKEHKVIHRGTILFGVLIYIAYIIYLCTIGGFAVSSAYKYMIYIALIAVLTIINQYKTDNYIIDLIILIEYMQLFFTTSDLIITILIAAIMVIFIIVSEKIKPVDKSNILMEENEHIEIPVGFCLVTANILSMTIQIIINII